MTVEKPRLKKRAASQRYPYWQTDPPKNTLAFIQYLWRRVIQKVTALDYELTKVNLTSVSLTSRQISALLLSGDIIALFCSFQGLHLIYGAQHWWPAVDAPIILAYILGLYLSNTYRAQVKAPIAQGLTRTLVSNLAITLLLVCTLYLITFWSQHNWVSQSSSLSTLALPRIGLAIALFSFWTSSSRLLLAQWQRLQTRSHRWLLLGFNEDQQPLLNDVLNDIQALQVSNSVAVLLAPGQQAPTLGRHTAIGQLAQLNTWLTHPWSSIVISDRTQLSPTQTEDLAQAKAAGTAILSLAELYETYCAKIPAQTLSEENQLHASLGFKRLSNRLGAGIKRFSDIALASIILLLVSPIMLITAALIKLDTPGPIFYSQTRTGRHMEPFQVHKFRSMVQDAEKHGAQWAKTQDSRITRVGRFIRLVRIDELPQLWNVLKGDMSMIGPRPERPEFDQQLAQSIPHYTTRYWIKPGITGWAQVLYPYGASIEDAYEKLAYDLYYIKNYSPWLDMLIVLKTVRVVLLGKGR